MDLLSIQKYCGSFQSGLKSVFLLLPEDVATETPQYGIIPMTSMPTLKEGKALYTIAFDRKSARYVEKKAIANRAGDYYDATLNFIIKKSRIELDMLSMMLLNRRVHAIIVYQDNSVKFVKNLREEDEIDSGDSSTRSQGVFRFTVRQTRKSNYVSGAIPPEIMGLILSYNANAVIIKGTFPSDDVARTIGLLQTGDVYETSPSTNYPSGPGVLKVVRD